MALATTGLGGLGIVQRVGAGVALDPDALAFIANVEAADGQALEAAIRSAYNQFVIDCKADASPFAGVSNWTAFGAVVPMMGARTLAGALVPLKGPAPTNFNFVSGDYGRITGLKGNGTNKYLNTNVPGASLIEASNAYSLWVSSAPGSGQQMLISTAWGQNPISDIFTTPPALSFRSHTLQAPSNFANGALATGFVGASRATLTGLTLRVAGESSARSQATATGPSAGFIAVFCRATPTGVINSATDSRIAFYSIGEAVNLELLDLRVTALRNAIATTLA